MAGLDRSFVLLRFSVGKETVKGRQRNLNTYRAKAEEIALKYADGQYDVIKQRLEQGVKHDVERELTRMASLYRRHIVGANGARNKPAGVLRSVIGGAEPLTLSSVLPAWAPRDATYLTRKFAETGNKSWFDNRGWDDHGKGWPSQSGLLFKESRAPVWEKMFGPISVRFQKNNIAQNARSTFNTGGSDHVRSQIGTLRVYALGKLTPDMLPGLAGLRVGMASDSGNDGLMGLVKQHDPQLAYRLGQRSTITNRYRPTLEPFLGFFLTRSIPAAVARRIKEGTLARITGRP